VVQARAPEGDVALLSRRDRVRAATSHEIIQTARRLLITQGSAALSLRAIARDMGMTAPAIYRYFGSYETLVHHVVADIFNELSDYVEAAVSSALEEQAAAARRTGTASPTDRTVVGLITACQAFRGWAVTHQAEFGMIFGAPLPGVDLYQEDPLLECGTRFGGIYLRLFAELWQIKPFDVPADDEIPEHFRTQLARYAEQIGTDLPLGVLQTFLRCWVSLYGTVTLEVFGHMRFALEDSSELFELMLTEVAALIGLAYPLPR
jgi:AcrR family transcriptional regulator